MKIIYKNNKYEIGWDLLMLNFCCSGYKLIKKVPNQGVWCYYFVHNYYFLKI